MFQEEVSIIKRSVLNTWFQLALRKHKRIVNFGLMHLAATNLCVWFRYLVIEVTESVHEADEHTEVNTYSGGTIVKQNNVI